MRWLPSIQWHLQGGAAQSVEGRLCRTLLSAITPGLGIHDGQRRIFARPTMGPWWAALLDEAVALNAAIPGGGEFNACRATRAAGSCPPASWAIRRGTH